MLKWFYLSIAIISELVATSALKESEGFTKLTPSILTVVGYGIAFYFLSLTMKEINLSITYAIWSGVGIVFLAFIGYFRYGQKLDTPALIGISFIVIGVLIINLFSKSTTH